MKNTKVFVVFGILILAVSGFLGWYAWQKKADKSYTSKNTERKIASEDLRVGSVVVYERITRFDLDKCLQNYNKYEAITMHAGCSVGETVGNSENESGFWFDSRKEIVLLFKDVRVSVSIVGYLQGGFQARVSGGSSRINPVFDISKEDFEKLIKELLKQKGDTARLRYFRIVE
ncbi:MAG: hypothetical protein HYS98_00830 [Deltaproteobacteria bacterium]|nr:hypothetical protein [Deltaproteobacteria bacterium]